MYNIIFAQLNGNCDFRSVSEGDYSAIPCQKRINHMILWEIKRKYEHRPIGFILSLAMIIDNIEKIHIFKSDEKGTILDFAELQGSYRGDLDHDFAIREHLKRLN